HLKKGCYRMSTREKIKRGNDLRVVMAGALRQDKLETTRLECRGEHTATRQTRKFKPCLPRRAHRDKINAKMLALLATASAPRQDKRENSRFACRGERTTTTTKNDVAYLI